MFSPFEMEYNGLDGEDRRNEGGAVTFRVAICDDDDIDSSFVGSCVSKWAESRGSSVAVDVFGSAESFLFKGRTCGGYDILLLDIEMGLMDGVELARRVRSDDKAVQIVFITGYSDYIADGYDVEALNYLMKPVNESKLFEVLDKAAAKVVRNARFVSFELGGEVQRIPIYDVRYLEVYGNYVTIHAKEDIVVKKTLGEFERELGQGFHRIGRSYIVNLGQVVRVAKSQVVLLDGTSLPLPRGAYEPLNRAIINQG